MITETSLIAFEKIKKDLSTCRLTVYKELKKLEYATNSMISESLGWSINRVTPRTNELRKMRLIKISHTSWCLVTKSKAQYLTLTKLMEENKWN